MHTQSKTHPTSSTHPLRKQLLSRCLPIGGTGCLMFLLSGGLYPRTWRLFFQACAQIPQLQMQMGEGFLFPFAVLAIQSLLLAVAWWVFLRLAIREGYALFCAWQTRDAPTQQAPLPAKALPAAVATATPLLQKPYTGQVLVRRAQPQGNTAPQPNSNGTMEPFVARPLTAPGNQMVENPFEVPEPSANPQKPSSGQQWPTEKGLQPASVTPQTIESPPSFKEKEKRVRTPVPMSPATPIKQAQEIEEREPRARSAPALPEEEASNLLRPPEPEQESVFFSSMLQELGFFSPDQSPGAETTPSSQAEKKDAPQLEPPANADHTSLAPNPFDVQSEVLHLFSSPDVPGQKPEERVSQDAHTPPHSQPQRSSAGMESGQFYTLGNPFEGTLPDVFQNDEDLKQSVLEQVSEALEQRTVRKRKATNQPSSADEKKTERRPPRKKPD
jgi:hypothetical protein